MKGASMRDILFKAKRISDGQWVEGYLYKQVGVKDRIYFAIEVIDNTVKAYEVDESTICQYTGLTDKNGNKIWENDVLKIARTSDSIGEYYYPPLDYPVNVVVKWDLCAWMWETIEKRKHYISFPDAWCHYEAEVIGNIFDNAELLEG